MRAFAAVSRVDEAALKAFSKRTLTQMSEELSRKGGGHGAMQTVCGEFSVTMQDACMRAMRARDDAVLRAARRDAADVFDCLQRTGQLVPPWLAWRSARKLQAPLHEFAQTLETSLPSREYSLRSRVVRSANSSQYGKMRPPPRDFARPEVEHVISRPQAAKLRDGGVLVLDPNPPLLSAAELRQVQEDMAGLDRRPVQGGGTFVSKNPCNEGSRHGMLPLQPSAEQAAASGLSGATCLLLRRLGALPHLVERRGWPRPLAVPPLVQLGVYPADGGAQ